MTIKDKYNIPQSTWQALVRDGVITSRVERAEEILSCYVKKKAAGIPQPEAIAATADEMRCSLTWVYIVIRKYH